VEFVSSGNDIEASKIRVRAGKTLKNKEDDRCLG
jgi:hypothetical protein